MSRFAQVINSERPVLVDFYADWCAPCKMMPPILKEVKNQFRESVRIIKVNVDRNPVIASRFQIQSIPTILLFKQGNVLWTGVGVKQAPEIAQALQSVL